ncbi:MAG: PorT family protein [Prevotellaceae bacterium]|nr:PorT family protein [Prevotellaceae bacterium]
MKKVLLIVALVGTCTAAQAKTLAFGVKAGINAPHLETNLADVKDASGLGFHAGLFGQVNIPIIGLGIQPEVLYLNQSISYINESNESASKSASYIDIPINITWGIDVKIARPFIALTPYLRYSLSDVTTFVRNAAAAVAPPTKQEMNKFDYGIGVGAGIDLFSKLQLMGRYSWGLNDLVKDHSYKVQGFTVSLGYIF